MLKPSSGIELTSLDVTTCLTAEELLPPQPKRVSCRAGGGGLSSPDDDASDATAPPWSPGCGRQRPLNFWDVAARLRSLELGILVGWRRHDDLHPHGARPCGTPSQKLTLNPADKEFRLLWGATDQLIVIGRTDGEEHRIEA